MLPCKERASNHHPCTLPLLPLLPAAADAEAAMCTVTSGAAWAAADMVGRTHTMGLGLGSASLSVAGQLLHLQRAKHTSRRQAGCGLANGAGKAAQLPSAGGAAYKETIMVLSPPDGAGSDLSLLHFLLSSLYSHPTTLFIGKEQTAACWAPGGLGTECECVDMPGT